MDELNATCDGVTLDQHCDDRCPAEYKTRVSKDPDRTCTSSGRPLASAIVCAKWSEHSGERSECLITTELPAMTAGITELTCAGGRDVMQSGMRA